jgi:hypothetical protein
MFGSTFRKPACGSVFTTTAGSDATLCSWAPAAAIIAKPTIIPQMPANDIRFMISSCDVRR